MDPIKPDQAFYIKLGKEGVYETECLTNPGKAKVGWDSTPSNLLQKTAGKIDWNAVHNSHLGIYRNLGTATSQTNQLQKFYESGPDILWVTFYNERLYWCFLDPQVELLDNNKKIRHTISGWYSTDISGNPLTFNRLSGSLLAMQGFRGTICNVGEKAYLLRKINAQTSPYEQAALAAQVELVHSLQEIIHELNWKEFELLTDLIFRNAGWQRESDLGKTQKSVDLSLFSPVANEYFRVQVKSEAGIPEFEAFEKLSLESVGSDQYYFAVHKPGKGLKERAKDSSVRVWLAEDIARLAVNYGLVDWLIAKAK